MPFFDTNFGIFVIVLASAFSNVVCIGQSSFHNVWRESLGLITVKKGT